VRKAEQSKIARLSMARFTSTVAFRHGHSVQLIADLQDRLETTASCGISAG
jgi:hypothetical protein